MKRYLILVPLTLLLCWGCTDEGELMPGSTTSSVSSTTSSSVGSGGGSSSSTGSGGAGGEGGAGGGPASLTGCLDRPDALLRPPAGALPCELIPPSVTLKP